MKTRWGDALTEANAWREYPRPQLVRNDWLNLNGRWSYAVARRSAPAPSRWQGEILVPFCIESELSGVCRRLTPTDRLWYCRNFDLVSIDARTLLHFGAVDYHAAIWLNGGYVASHDGGFDAFTLDISDFVHPGANELVVAVDDPTSAGDQPRGKQHLKPQGIWYTPVTGIWQTAWIEQVPRANHIAEVRMIPDPEDRSVMVQVMLHRPTRDSTLAVSLRVSLDGRTIVERAAPPDRPTRVPIEAPVLWSPEQPTLYDLEVRLIRVRTPFPARDPHAPSDGLRRDTPLRGPKEAELYLGATPAGEALDTVRTYFGMRSIRVGPHPQSLQPTLLLNGDPAFHLATLDQGWWPDGLHTPPADAAIVHEIEFLKASGFNAVRKHIKVEPARYYYHCDRLGLLVWQDMPSGFIPAQLVAPNDEDEGLRSNASTETYELELQRMVHGLRNHPSIVVWVLHNEGWGQFDTKRLVDRIRGMDPSRPIDAVSGWLDVGAGDIIDRHDYAPEPESPLPDGTRAPVIGEYGGIGWPVAGHLWNPEMRNWGYQTYHSQAQAQEAYARATAAIVRARRDHGLCAAVYTQTTDVEGEINGLLTYDRALEKFPRQWLAQRHAPLRSHEDG